MSIPTCVQELRDEFAHLQQHVPVRLTSDQRTSMRYFILDLAMDTNPLAHADARDRPAIWTRTLHRLEDFVDRNGRLPRENNRLGHDDIPKEERELATWIRTQRRAALDGSPCSYRLRRLACLPGYSEHPLVDGWSLQLTEYRNFISLHKDVPKVRSADPAERRAARWAAKQRHAYWRHRLPQGRVDVLANLDFWTWGRRS